jgi:predicted metal-dependent TIM-barrel fold hydrolase
MLVNIFFKPLAIALHANSITMKKLLLTSAFSIALLVLAGAQERRDSVIIIKKYTKDTLVIKSDTLIMGPTGRTRVTIDTA